MKKPLLLLLFILFVFVYQASAQTSIGAKAGINWNSFRGNKAFDVIPGLSVGAFARYPVLPFLTAKAELLYFQQGANLVDYQVLPGDLFRNDAEVVFHQVQLPIIAEFGLPALADEALQPKLSIGGFYAYNIYARERYTNVAKVPGYEKIYYNGHDNVTSQYKRSQYGLIGALGADLKILNMPVYLEFRYTHNLTNITKSGMTTRYNLKETFKEWGDDNLRLGTVSFNIAVTLQYL
ncbi:MAG TPA: porin family protein [Cyclobacteriaceae bacterium]|nr:porin family protein [Cyclobacteriaceae bacterium]